MDILPFIIFLYNREINTIDKFIFIAVTIIELSFKLHLWREHFVLLDCVGMPISF